MKKYNLLQASWTYYIDHRNAILVLYLIDILISFGMAVLGLVFILASLSISEYKFLVIIPLSVISGYFLLIGNAWKMIKMQLMFDLFEDNTSSITFLGEIKKLLSLTSKTYKEVLQFHRTLIRTDVRAISLLPLQIINAFNNSDIEFNRHLHKQYVVQAYPYFKYTQKNKKNKLAPCEFTSETSEVIHHIANSFGVTRILLAIIKIGGISLITFWAFRVTIVIVSYLGFTPENIVMLLLIMIVLMLPAIFFLLLLVEPFFLITDCFKHRFVINNLSIIS